MNEGRKIEERENKFGIIILISVKKIITNNKRQNDFMKIIIKKNY